MIGTLYKRLHVNAKWYWCWSCNDKLDMTTICILLEVQCTMFVSKERIVLMISGD